MIALAIVAILISVALPAFERQREKTRVAIAVSDIGAIAAAIRLYHTDAGEFPSSLAEVGYGGNLDPWGRPYEYLNYASGKGNGKPRKDKKLKPLNSDFDLYSVGKDGQSMAPLNAKASRDDVVRARDGAFIGLAIDFDP
jgi:general secretion pathway protein G